MKGTIDDYVPLNYVTFHIFPPQNRYEVSACSGDIIENLFAGHLEQLLLHLCDVKERCFEESIDDFKFKVNIPENIFGTAWFTKSTLTRFLHIVDSPKLLSKTIDIEDEITQLEEARKFHASLYAQGHHDEFGCREADTCKWNDKGKITGPESNIASSDASRNELLRAMDLRIVALREELYASFNQSAGAVCSVEEISDLARFCDHFGTQILRNSIFKLLEHYHKSQIVDPLNVGNSSTSNPCDFGNGSDKKADCNNLTTKSAGSSVKSVMFGVSPAKVAQVERQSSSGSDISSHLSDEPQNFAESRTLPRTETSRRSVSSVRRGVQIGRNGPRRTSTVAIKSLNYFPAGEKAVSQRNVAGNNNVEEEGSYVEPEKNVPRMTVHDAINLFESKQREHANINIQKQRVSTDFNITGNKDVLRRWSAGMSDFPANSKHGVPLDDSVHASPNKIAVLSSVEEKAESSFTSTSHDLLDTPGIDVKVDPSSDAPIKQDEVVVKGMNDSGEWNRLKEIEVKKMMKQMEETNPIHATMVSESKEYNKGMKDKKIQEANTLKRPEKEVRIRAIKRIVDQKKTQNVGKEQNPVKKPHKLQKNVQPSSNIRKETSKCVTVKKDSSLPSRQKSLPAPPTSPASRSKLKSQKTQQAQSLHQNVIKVEKSEQPKGNPSNPNKNFKNGKNQKAVIISEKASKTKILSNSSDCMGKNTKKSSVVPLESKPYLRKGSGTSPRLACGVVKSKVESQRKDKKTPERLENSAKEEAVEDKESPEILENSAKEEAHEDILGASEAVNDAENYNLVGRESESSEVEGRELELESETIVDNEHKVPICVEKSIENDHVVIVDDKNADEEEMQDESAISLSSWVEIEEEAATKNDGCNDASVVVGGGSSRVRQSLSQMMQDDNDGFVVEWGNAENPPTLVFQKDAPKGLKRLLMFGRKTRGDASPSTISEEDDPDDSKSNGQLNTDRYVDRFSQKRLEAHVSATTSSTKATRSFFSLSAFKGGKPNYPKLH